MGLNEIVNVTIDRQTRAVSQAGFGTLLILGSNLPASSRIRTYTSIQGVEADFAANTPERFAAAAAFSQNPAPVRIAIGRQASGEAVGAALSAIEDVSGDWYGLALLSRTDADITAASAWIETRRKLFVACSADPNVGVQTSTSDIAFVLKGLGRNRTAVVYHNLAGGDTHPDVAWLARQLSTPPGTQTWMFKTLVGVPPVSLNDSASGAVRGKNANTYESIGGVSITREGKAASGEYLDVIHGVDWLQARLTERVFSRLVNLGRIPYTDAGVAVFEGEVRAQLDAAVEIGVLAGNPAPTISVPRVRDVSPNDRAMRTLPDIRFVATLSGAVHQVTIQGTVSV